MYGKITSFRYHIEIDTTSRRLLHFFLFRCHNNLASFYKLFYYAIGTIAKNAKNHIENAARLLGKLTTSVSSLAGTSMSF
jgi:hypothetical protein